MAPMGRYIIEVHAFNESLQKVWVKVSERSLQLDAYTIAEIYSYDNPVQLYRIRDRHAIPPEQQYTYFQYGHKISFM